MADAEKDGTTVGDTDPRDESENVADGASGRASGDDAKESDESGAESPRADDGDSGGEGEAEQPDSVTSEGDDTEVVETGNTDVAGPSEDDPNARVFFMGDRIAGIRADYYCEDFWLQLDSAYKAHWRVVRVQPAGSETVLLLELHKPPDEPDRRSTPFFNS